MLADKLKVNPHMSLVYYGFLMLGLMVDHEIFGVLDQLK